VEVVDVDTVARSVVQSGIDYDHTTGLDADNFAGEPFAIELISGFVPWFHGVPR
jgi:hypothetical protein